ncbi:MAG TPA: rhombosortase [Thermoanaerobaculia bacterium]|nr:rhombosortase [Thermoanaerobaculia bacterium]
MSRAPFPWLTLGVVAAAAALSLSRPELFEYLRGAVERGEAWRLLTGQLVHWTPRMAVIDLAAVALLGTWLERVARRRTLVLALALALPLIALTVHLLSPTLTRYRGSSGLAAALFLALAARLWIEGRGGARWLALLAAGGFVLKVVLELALGRQLFAGALPAGIAVTPAVHLAGAAAGLSAAVLVQGSRWEKGR